MSSRPPWETKRTLRAFADGVNGAGGRDQSGPDRIVEEAAETLDSVEAAARFVAAGGEDRLAEAVVRAVRAGEGETVNRGREVLRALRALEAALAGESPQRPRVERQ